MLFVLLQSSHAAREPETNCGLSALSSLKRTEQKIYRRTRLYPTSGKLSVGKPVFSSSTIRLMAMDGVSGGVFGAQGRSLVSFKI